MAPKIKTIFLFTDICQLLLLSRLRGYFGCFVLLASGSRWHQARGTEAISTSNLHSRLYILIKE